jgi:hypothetical protein
MYISDQDKETILNRAQGKLLDVIREHVTLKKSGADYVGKCPKCGHDRGLKVSPSKGIFKCFHCNQLEGNSAVSFLMRSLDVSYPDALKMLAEHFGIALVEPQRSRTATAKVSGAKSRQPAGTYCEKMLSASGLTFEDVTAKVYAADDSKTIFQRRTFFPGTIDQYGNIEPSGDDALIAYYDLDGLPVMYEVKDKKGKPTGKKKEFFRVRWQHPSEHLDKDGKETKYRTPYGAGTPIYIPERLRAAYKGNLSIERLFIQEGEKKAEKACKHGLLSVAVSGIQNIGMGGRLPEDVVKIIQRCGVKEVVFLLDSDCFDLSSNLKIGDNVQKRPRNFFYAVRNYKEYFRSLRNRDIYVEILFGHIIKNDAGDKGVDDLLASSLAGREQEFISDVEAAVNDKNHAGKYVQLYKITTCTDHKIEEIWSLNSSAAFAERYKNVLKELPEFTIGRHRWRFGADGALESTQPLEPDEQYWSEHQDPKRDTTRYEFRYGRCFTFLRNRGFGRYLRPAGDFCFVHLDPPFVKTVEPWEIRDFLTDFTKTIAVEGVLEMIYRGGPQYLGPDKLGNLEFIHPNFEAPIRERQNIFFDKKCWQITAGAVEEVEYSAVQQHVWADAKKNFPAARSQEPMLRIAKSEGKFSCILTEEGKKCHFLRFLENTSNFTWRKEQLIREGKSDVVISDGERYDNTLHLIAKLCAIGYMVSGAKDRSAAKAVVAMDGMQSEVGASNGRSGKSIIGELLKQVIPTCYINGKTIDLESDRFIWDELTEKDRSVFIDDVKPSFNFELLFANITGDWGVNYKGGRRCTFPFTTSPKIYITTNHALKGEGSSFRDRQWLIAFSDYYNDKRKPIDDFGVMFFDEWDFDQWNLTWNLIAQCVQLYFLYGCVESPAQRLEVRRLRQSMGEEFLSWAEEYFSDVARRNVQIARKDLYANFVEYAPDQRKWCKPTAFKSKIKDYCAWKGYKFNPHKYDPVTGIPYQLDKDGKPVIDDKSGGVEYFTIGDENFATPPGAPTPDDSVLHTPF